MKLNFLYFKIFFLSYLAQFQLSLSFNRNSACLSAQFALQKSNNEPNQTQAQRFFQDLHEKNIQQAESYYGGSCTQPEPVRTNITYQGNSVELKKVNFVDCLKLSDFYDKFFKNFKVQNWQHHFKRNQIDCNNSKNCDVLFENYVLYKYESYLEFLKTIKSFDSRIVKLQKAIESDGQLKHKLEKLKSFPFAKIANIHDEIVVKNLRQSALFVEKQLNPEFPSTNYVNNKIETIENWELGAQDTLHFFNKYYKARVDAYKATLQTAENVTKNYNLNNESIDFLGQHGVYAYELSSFTGNHLQQAIHLEIVDAINEGTLLNKKLNTTEFNKILNFSLLAYEFNKRNEIEQAANLSYIGHALYEIGKGAAYAGWDNIKGALNSIAHPIDFAEKIAHGIGNLVYEVTSRFAHFVLNPKTDAQYQKEFEDFCDEQIKDFKKDPDKYCQGLGYVITDYVLARTACKYNLHSKVINNCAQFLKSNQIGQQTCKIIDLVATKGIKGVNDTLKFVIENKEINKSKQIAQGIVKTESFIAATVANAIENNNWHNYFASEVLKNNAKYKANSYYKNQFQKYNLPIQYIPATPNVITPHMLSNGDQLFLDKSGSIWKRDYKTQLLTIDASPTFRKQVASKIKPPNTHTRDSLAFIDSQIVEEKFNVPSIVKNNEIQFFENNAKHIFRKSPGHLNDTWQNRNLLIDLASNKQNYLGIDERGNHWYAKTLSDGKQVWAIVRDNYIRNGGLNDEIHPFNNKTGLSKQKR